MTTIRPAIWLDSMHITAMWLKMHQEVIKRPMLLKEHSNVKNLFHQVVARIENPDWSILIAENDKKVIGFVMGLVKWPHYNQCHLIAFNEASYVYPEYRANGVHKLLLEKQFEIGKARGCVEFEFTCINDPSVLAAYDKLGFEPIQVVMRQKEKTND